MMNLAWSKTMDTIKANPIVEQEFLPTFNESWDHNSTMINLRINIHISWSHKQTRDPRHVGFTLGGLYGFLFSKGVAIFIYFKIPRFKYMMDGFLLALGVILH
jgi:hypothetical protein